MGEASTPDERESHEFGRTFEHTVDCNNCDVTYYPTPTAVIGATYGETYRFAWIMVTCPECRHEQRETVDDTIIGYYYGLGATIMFKSHPPEWVVRHYMGGREQTVRAAEELCRRDARAIVNARTALGAVNSVDDILSLWE